ncbi:hypothetical protein ANAPH1_00211 [Anaplasma phagocytophilum]|nr:hypothetical protein ANAPH1_00211 [Anaplasma phagocytophilum]
MQYTLSFSLAARSLYRFWFIIVSSAIAVFPVFLSPIINSRCPRPTGISISIVFIPVCKGSLTGCLAIIPGAFTSTGFSPSHPDIAPSPSRGIPKGLTTRPNNENPTGTFINSPVHSTESPSFTSLSSPKITTLAISLSSPDITPRTPEAKATVSPNPAPCNP